MERICYRNSEISTNIFSHSGKLSKGEIVQYRFIELLIITQICFYAWKWGFYLPKLSSVQFPIGIANYINISFLFHYPFFLINAVLISTCCLIGYFRWSRFSYLLAVFLMHLQYAARFSQGKIGHGSVLPGLVFLLIGVTMIFFKNEKIRVKTATGLMIFFIGLSYDSAALCKLVASGFSWPDGSHLWLWITERSVDQLSQNGIVSYSVLQHLVLNNWLIATFVLCTGLLIECLGFCLWIPKLRPFISTALIGMHIGIYFLLKIDFSSYIFLLILVCYPWYKLYDRIADKLKTRPNLSWLFKSS